MNQINKNRVVLLILLLLAGCSSDSPFEPGDENQANQLKLSKFGVLQQNVFTNNCALSGCHAGANPQAGLSLTEGNAYSNLVNVNSTQRPTMSRVKPGDSDNSWLMKKLRGNGTTSMPPGGQLSAAVIDSIAKWIDQGALND